MKKAIGIMGGMGPEATAYMYDLILKNTEAATDQDHIHVVINSYPQVPPRTDAILGQGPSPTAFLVEGIEALITAGADFIVMPCITAHYFIPEVKEEISFDFVSLPEEAAGWANDWVPDLKTAGILASSGTLQTGLFHEAFAARGISLISPDDEEQALLMDAIFGPQGIKAGYRSGGPRETIVALAQNLVQRGAGAVLTGCTEIPLALRPEDLSVPLIEPMRIAAGVCIEKAGYTLKSDR